MILSYHLAVPQELLGLERLEWSKGDIHPEPTVAELQGWCDEERFR